MAIIKSLKETGLDIYLNYHPKVLLLKKESKKLHKELKNQNISLMQSQTIVAQNYGFNDWHHFMSIIKKHYNSELDKKLFTITKDISFNNNQILFGKDINFNHFKWQDDSAMRTHQLILGEHLYNTYDLFLAHQTISQNKEVFFLNPTSTQDIDSLISYAKKAGRENDIRIFDFTNNSKYQLYAKKINLNNTNLIINSSIIYNLGMHKDNKWLNKATLLIQSLIPHLYKDNQFDLQIFKNSLSFDYIINLINNTNIPEITKNYFSSYLNSLHENNSLSNKNEFIIEQHNYLKIRIEQSIEWLNNQIFSINGIPLENLLFQNNTNNKYINIFNFGNSTHDIIYHYFILNSMKNKLGHHLGTINDFNLSKINSKKDTSFIFIRECHLSSNLNMLLAQARSSGISLNLSYSSKEKLEQLSFVSYDIIFANTLTKILANEEKNKLFNLNHSNDSSILNNPNITSINIDYFWLLKNTSMYQINFNMNYLNFH